MWAWTPWFAILILVCSAARTKEGQVSRDKFEVIPDLQLYPRNMKGPEALTASQAKLLQQRVARCYNPRASREYSDVQWQPALDKYMREEVTGGLKKVPRVIITGMAWGAYLPVTWLQQGVSAWRSLAFGSDCPPVDHNSGEVHAPSLDLSRHPRS